jgi:predicted enzyme related to lactoylglutathione lyase
MAICFDPNGGEFDIWEPRKLQGTEVDSTRHGSPSWFETLTTDVDRARSFYVELFGWTPKIQHNSHGSYTTFNLDETPVAGMMGITPEMGPVPPHWGIYFTVNDIEESAKRATDLGATLFVPPTNIADVGRFCGVISPQGVRFYLITYA